MHKHLTAALLASAIFAAPAAAHEHEAILGSWDTVLETPMGNFEAGLTVAQGAEGYTVVIEDRPPEGGEAMPPMESTISDVAVEGATVTFLRSLTTPQGPMELTYTLTADGDALSGEASSSFGGVPITGTRAGEGDAMEAAAEETA
ncbi:hypothetical protein OZN62_07575 [Aurantiacibacter sp. MUD11]|uniref:hypothetical protein n=1 Tax=Aurantiacibacter sp. MUD11 TaxID=3003265 RepID=UPI0022AB0566|nr:hypothetical protein [Aurantiacibacter sp. MUD11]WAT16805.1 hypothetical protein OZN62_07575 [Aurantiacibacter sp. MUD11]